MIEIYHEDMTASRASRNAYNKIYSDRGILQRDSFYLWLIQLLDPDPGKLIIDISCGQGRLVNLANSMGITALGMDFSMGAVRLAYSDASHSTYCVSDGEHLPLEDASIDFITHIGSLEHYGHPGLGASEIGRVLKPAGKACILLPNAFGLFGNIKYVVNHGDVFDDGQPIQRYATRKTWESMLEKGGLKVDRVVAYSEVDFPRTWKDARWLILHPQKIARALFSLLTPLNLANHFVFLCSKNTTAAGSIPGQGAQF